MSGWRPMWRRGEWDAALWYRPFGLYLWTPIIRAYWGPYFQCGWRPVIRGHRDYRKGTEWQLRS